MKLWSQDKQAAVCRRELKYRKWFLHGNATANEAVSWFHCPFIVLSKYSFTAWHHPFHPWLIWTVCSVYRNKWIVLNKRYNVRRKEKEEVTDNPAFWLAARSKPRLHVLYVCCIILDTFPQRKTDFVSLATLKSQLEIKVKSSVLMFGQQLHPAELNLKDQKCGNTQGMKMIMRLVWSHTSGTPSDFVSVSVCHFTVGLQCIGPNIYLLLWSGIEGGSGMSFCERRLRVLKGNWTGRNKVFFYLYTEEAFLSFILVGPDTLYSTACI